MKRFGWVLMAAGSLAALLQAHTAWAQEVPEEPAAEQAGEGDIVVTGTRVAGRSRLDTASPVDVLGGTQLRQQGTTELASALATVAPSIDFPRPSAVDGTDAIRPATLRGLAPDQTLVLVNGVRANSSALLNVNGSVGRGSSAVDLNTIPTVALDRIEVLRDGASAQYGSDAIAGVVNVRLREARAGGGATVTYGFYDTEVETARGRRHTTGEHAVTVSGWQGIALGQQGFLTLSGEYLDRSPTNRADVDPRVTPNAITGRFGDPEVEQVSGFVNAGVPIGTWSLYGWAGYQNRDSRSAAFPRLPSAAGAVSGIWPNGFLPIIHTESENLNTALGFKGEAGGWAIDLNVSYGRNKIDFWTRESANYSYGNASPTDFYDGAVAYDQLVAGLDVTRSFDVLHSLNLALGLEARREGYKIEPGERASYDYPPSGAVAGQAPGAQGFVGFSPLNAIERSRRNFSGYLDIEAQVTDAFLIGVAGRAEHYSDFGETATGKLSLRYDIAPWLALRGTASTGFRAPSLQQQYFTSIASVIQNGSPVLTGTFPSTSPVGTALGGLPLEPERSTNFSAGAVIRSGGFDLTVDAYQIRLRNQLALSENIPSSFSGQVGTILAPFNVQAARFFINGLRSRVRGVDVVAHYRVDSEAAGRFDLTVAANLNQTRLDRGSIPLSTGTVSPAPVLFARSRILTIEQGTPGEKVTGAIDWSLGGLGATARVSYYGDVNQPGTAANGSADIHTGSHAVTDLELRYQPAKGGQFALGVSNLFDVYPDFTPAALNTTGVVGFPYYSPFGFGGRYFYVRAGLSW